MRKLPIISLDSARLLILYLTYYEGYFFLNLKIEKRGVIKMQKITNKLSKTMMPVIIQSKVVSMIK